MLKGSCFCRIQDIEDYGQDKYDQVEESYNEAKDNITEVTKGTYNVIIDVTSDFYEKTKNEYNLIGSIIYHSCGNIVYYLNKPWEPRSTNI